MFKFEKGKGYKNSNSTFWCMDRSGNSITFLCINNGHPEIIFSDVSFEEILWTGDEQEVTVHKLFGDIEACADLMSTKAPKDLKEIFDEKMLKLHKWQKVYNIKSFKNFIKNPDRVHNSQKGL